jgi:hypothetical protein
VGLHLPCGFSRDAARGDARVQIVVDGTNPNTATVARVHVERILKGAGLDALWPQYAALLAMGTGVLGFAGSRFRKAIA